jgi:transposase
MRLKISKSKNAQSLYVIKDITINGKRTTKIVEKLGTYSNLQKKLNGEDPFLWAKNYIESLNKKEKANTSQILLKYSPSKIIDKNKQCFFNGGYLFLQKIYYELGLNEVCKHISDKYKFTFNLNSIFSRLIYSRIIFPSSKLSTFNLCSRFMEQPDFELHHIYRALQIISKEFYYIQSSLYNNSLRIAKRNTGILYYDCTNYFFELEQPDGLKQYGMSKEHRPNPIVQMGLFMDGDGIPLAFNITKGNTNEQITLRPLEKKILSDFKLSKFIVCTDAGLASIDNREFNDKSGRAFITTQSIKKLKAYQKKWALDSNGWKLPNDTQTYDISKIDNMLEHMNEIDKNRIKSKIFYKERWINEDGLEQRLIVTYSIKYRDYQRSIRNSQIERAEKTIKSNPTKIKKTNQNDYKRFIKKTSCTKDGEIAEKDTYSINYNVIAKEEVFDGFYGVCTNLEDNVSEITKINKRRWEIEECFRIMKSEFKARPVYLSRDDCIKAHFTTCFIALTLYRFLEKRLGEKYTCSEIISGLRSMNFYEVPGEGYIPTYTRTDFTDDLHEVFGFRTDYQILNTKIIKKILKQTKK